MPHKDTHKAPAKKPVKPPSEKQKKKLPPGLVTYMEGKRQPKKKMCACH